MFFLDALIASSTRFIHSSDKYSVSKQTIINTVNDIKRKNAKQRIKKQIQQVVTPRYSAQDINPQKRFYKRAAVAEESIISVLLNNPDCYTFAQQKIKPDNFLTDLNKRIITHIYSLIEQHLEVDISNFGDFLNGAEMGYVVSLLNSVGAKENAMKVLSDSIEILLSENKINAKGENNDSDENWLEQINSIVENKKGD